MKQSCEGLVMNLGSDSFVDDSNYLDSKGLNHQDRSVETRRRWTR